MDTAQWPQEILVKPIEEIIGGVRNNNKTWGKAGIFLDERNRKKELDGGLKCPRCNSSNTKFCYYNNYSLTQPRYFCKSCRRYWTEGGSLRNIPVGGSSRKNKRPSSSSSSSSSSSPPPPSYSPSSSLIVPLDPKKFPDHQLPQSQNPKIISHSQDLNLSFPPPPPSSSHHHHNNLSEIVVGGGNNNPSIASLATATTTTKATELSAMELLTGMASNNSKGLNCFIPIMQPSVVPDEPGSVYAPGLPDLHDHQFKPSQLLGFSLDGYSIPTEPSNGGVGGRLMQLPFEDLKQGKDQQGDSTGYWTGMLGGGSW